MRINDDGLERESLRSFARFLPNETTGSRLYRHHRAAGAARSRAFKPEEISECLIYRLRRIGRRRPSTRWAPEEWTTGRGGGGEGEEPLSFYPDSDARARTRLLFSNLNRLHKCFAVHSRDRSLFTQILSGPFRSLRSPPLP